MLAIIGNTGELVHKDNDIAEALFTNFFPPLPPYLSSSHTASSNQLPMEPLINKEIQKVIYQLLPIKHQGETDFQRWYNSIYGL